MTILTTIWPGVTERMTSAPIALGRTPSMNWRTTGSATSASSSAVRTSRRAASTSASESAPRPRSLSNTSPRRLLRPSNILLVRPYVRPNTYRADARTFADQRSSPKGEPLNRHDRLNGRGIRPAGQGVKRLDGRDANPLIQNDLRPIRWWSIVIFLAVLPLLLAAGGLADRRPRNAGDARRSSSSRAWLRSPWPSAPHGPAGLAGAGLSAGGLLADRAGHGGRAGRVGRGHPVRHRAPGREAGDRRRPRRPRCSRRASP